MTAQAPAPARRPEFEGVRLRSSGIIASEALKLTTVRSTWWSFGVSIVLALGLALLLGASFTPDTASVLGADTLLLSGATAHLQFVGLVVAVLGALSIGGEYSTGMIRSSVTAVPGRLAVLVGKAVVTFVWTFLLGAVSIAAAYLAALPFLGREGFDATLDGSVLLAFLGAAVYLGFVSLFGLGIGTLVRSAAGGIAIVVGVLLVLTTVLGLLSMSIDWIGDLSPYLLSNAGGAMSMIEGNPLFGEQTLEPIGATLVTAVWPAAALVIGAVALKARDA